MRRRRIGGRGGLVLKIVSCWAQTSVIGENTGGIDNRWCGRKGVEEKEKRRRRRSLGVREEVILMCAIYYYWGGGLGGGGGIGFP